jgi:hypothetical protein
LAKQAEEISRLISPRIVFAASVSARRTLRAKGSSGSQAGEDSAKLFEIGAWSARKRVMSFETAGVRRRSLGAKSAKCGFSRTVFGEHVFVKISAEDAPERRKRRWRHARQRCSSGYDVRT